MPHQLHEEARQRILEIARGISVANHLNEPIQRELYGHMEDKLLGYLNGEERLSEADALILVREHFGKPETVKELLQEVYRTDVAVSYMRRLLMIAIATMTALLIIPDLLTIVMNTIHSWIIPESLWSFGVVDLTLYMILPIFMLVYILKRWRYAMDTGKPVWLLQWRLHWSALLLFVLIGIYASGPWAPLLYTDFSEANSSALYGYCSILFRLLKPGLYCLVWLWWLDRPPYVARATWKTIIAWLLFYQSMAEVRYLLPYHRGQITYSFTPGSTTGNLAELIGVVLLKFFITGLAGGLTYFIYRAIQRRRSCAVTSKNV